MSYESTIMEHKGYKAQVMEAPRLVGDSNFGLPPGQPIDAYPVDVFIKIPENWMKGPGIFVVPVKKNKGLWFNFRQNSEINTAVIMTVKGCNPITGLQTSGFHLEKYEKSCPKHGCDFLAERFCPECNYKWPDRNFLSGDPLWWDVWKTSDGIGRQFYFTEDELKDIATHKIGSENTVPAFGFAFYSPKERRPEKEPARVFGASLIYGNKDYKTWEQLYTYTPKENDQAGTRSLTVVGVDLLQRAEAMRLQAHAIGDDLLGVGGVVQQIRVGDAGRLCGAGKGDPQSGDAGQKSAFHHSHSSLREAPAKPAPFLRAAGSPVARDDCTRSIFLRRRAPGDAIRRKTSSTRRISTGRRPPCRSRRRDRWNWPSPRPAPTGQVLASNTY